MSAILPAPEALLFPFGLHETVKGAYLLDELGATSCMDKVRGHFGAQLRLFNAPADLDSKDSLGWFALELRADGLWATKITLLLRGRKLVEAGQKYLDPWIMTLKDPSGNENSNRILEIIGATLSAEPGRP